MSASPWDGADEKRWAVCTRVYGRSLKLPYCQMMVLQFMFRSVSPRGRKNGQGLGGIKLLLKSGETTGNFIMDLILAFGHAGRVP